jgi:hypothetical protein
LSILIVKLYDMSSVIDDHSEVTSLGRRGGTSVSVRRSPLVIETSMG